MVRTKFSKILAHYEKHDPRVFAVLQTVDLGDWFEERSSDHHYQNLTREIIYQQLAGAAASAIYGRFEKLVGGKVRPEKVLDTPDQSFRDAGLSWAKVRYVKDLAAKALSGEVVLTGLSELDDEGVVTELTKVKGIGRWTAEMFLLFTLQREDIFSFGDLGLRNGFAKLYGKEHPTDMQIKRVIAKWSPYKSYGAIALWHHLDNRPR